MFKTAGETPMNRKWLLHRLRHYAILFASGAALVGLTMALRPGGADAQQNSRKDSGKTARQAPANVTQAAPSASRREAKAEHRDARRSRRRAMTLGAQLQAHGNQGLQVSSLEENSIAARSGLQQNDRIVSVDGRAFASSRQLDAYLASQGGRRIPMVIDRNGQRLTIFVNPAPLEGNTAWLGVYLQEGDSGANGARITGVYPSGPAARAGLQGGDTITQIDDQKIESPADVVMFVLESEPQAEAQFTIVRNDQQMQLPVVLASRDHFVPSAAQANGYGQPANPNFAGPHDQQANSNDEFDDVPPHAMQLEHDRRIAEQHQRIEQELQALREEIQQLRDELKKK
jgi:membrane-associated protease RseP (regulator of RpoE activity)